MNNACSIYYDMQRDSFYRVDKQTGDMTRSFLNGDKLPLFHPNITGFEPKRRRVNAYNNKESTRCYLSV